MVTRETHVAGSLQGLDDLLFLWVVLPFSSWRALDARIGLAGPCIRRIGRRVEQKIDAATRRHFALPQPNCCKLVNWCKLSLKCVQIDVYIWAYLTMPVSPGRATPNSLCSFVLLRHLHIQHRGILQPSLCQSELFVLKRLLWVNRHQAVGASIADLRLCSAFRLHNVINLGDGIRRQEVAVHPPAARQAKQQLHSFGLGDLGLAGVHLGDLGDGLFMLFCFRMLWTVWRWMAWSIIMQGLHFHLHSWHGSCWRFVLWVWVFNLHGGFIEIGIGHTAMRSPNEASAVPATRENAGMKAAAHQHHQRADGTTQASGVGRDGKKEFQTCWKSAKATTNRQRGQVQQAILHWIPDPFR